MPHKFTNPGDLARAQLDESGVGSNAAAQEALEKALNISGLVMTVRSKVEDAKNNRADIEHQWFDNIQAFKGIDTVTTKFRQSEENEVYLRTTAVKTRAAYSQIVEALFSDGRFPIEVTSTEVPFGVSEYAHLSGDGAQEQQGVDAEASQPFNDPADIGFAGDGQDLAPGATFEDIVSGNAFLGGLEEEFEGANLVQGPARQGEAQIAIAKRLSRNMDKLIQDQLTASKGKTVVRKAIFECCLLGTGAIKGPFNVNKQLPKWTVNEETGKREYTPVSMLSPMIEYVSMWNLYWDTNANTTEDAEWFAENHRMTVHQLFDLKKRPHFDAEEIDILAVEGGNYTEHNFEDTIRGNKTGSEENNLFEVIEFWGYMPTKEVEEFGVEIPEDSGDMLQVNIWYSGNRVLRVVLNPFLPQRLPYFIFPYEQRPFELEGIGVPELMEDSQRMMNGFARLAVDNLALAGNVMMAIDDSALVQGQTDDIYPGKIWHIISGTPANQAIQDIRFPNTAPENLQMMREFRQQADESTGIPSIAHGQTGVSGFGRTLGGMNTLLQNASLNTKTTIRNLDDHLFTPLGQAYFQWNMQFSTEDFPEIEGDLEVKATGSQALQMKEVRSQRLQTFLQISANPAIAPLIKLPTVVRELAIALEMDPDEILNSPEEQQIYAALMGLQGMQQPAQGVNIPAPATEGPTGNNMSAGNPEGVGGGTPPELAQ